MQHARLYSTWNKYHFRLYYYLHDDYYDSYFATYGPINEEYHVQHVQYVRIDEKNIIQQYHKM
mgnify:CR=1 FL=1